VKSNEKRTEKLEFLLTETEKENFKYLSKKCDLSYADMLVELMKIFENNHPTQRVVTVEENIFTNKKY